MTPETDILAVQAKLSESDDDIVLTARTMLGERFPVSRTEAELYVREIVRMYSPIKVLLPFTSKDGHRFFPKDAK